MDKVFIGVEGNFYHHICPQRFVFSIVICKLEQIGDDLNRTCWTLLQNGVAPKYYSGKIIIASFNILWQNVIPATGKFGMILDGSRSLKVWQPDCLRSPQISPWFLKMLEANKKIDSRNRILLKCTSVTLLILRNYCMFITLTNF